jgi:arginase family enzyme
MLRLSVGADRRVARAALRAAVRETHSLGLIWIDSKAALEMPEEGTGDLPESAVLAEALGLVAGGALQPQLSPENVVLVGLREASPAEARLLGDSRATVLSMAEIDASGMGEVIREALRIATSGTRGFHVGFSATATEMPGFALGAGGLTVRETHLAMETIAWQGGMISMSVAGLTTALDPRVSAELVSFVMSAFGKRIL